MQQNNKKMMNVDILEYEKMCAKAAKYTKNRKLNNEYVKNNREKKQKYSIIHKLVNRWRIMSKTVFCLHF